MNKEIFLVTIYKKYKYDDSKYLDTQVGENVEALIRYICSHYKLDRDLLIKDDNDHFPYFSDGGFKYSYDHKDWDYTFICHPATLHS
jgi:hypothetical protein